MADPIAILDQSAKAAGFYRTAEITPLRTERRCLLALNPVDWPEDPAPITFGFERSLDGGRTWLHWVSAVTRSGMTGRFGLPSLGVPMFDKESCIVRAFLQTERACKTGLIYSTRDGTRSLLQAGEHHSWAAVGRKNEASGQTLSSLNVTLNSTDAGNFIALGSSIWHSGGASTVAVSDGTNGSYTQSFYKTSGDPAAGLHYIANNAGGNLTITANPSPDNSDMWIAVEEFSGGATSSPQSGLAVTNAGTGTTSSTGSTVETDADCLVIAVVDLDATGGLTENAGGEGFTLSNEFALPGPPNGQPGSFVYKIVTGTPHPSHSWTNSVSAPWCCGIAAFKPAASGDTLMPQISL